MIMLAVDDIDRTRRFYEGALSWRPYGGAPSQKSVKYLTGSVLTTMIDRQYICRESGLSGGSGKFGIVCVVDVESRDRVDDIAEAVQAGGGKITSTAKLRDGGLYSFYFLDRDENPWEVVWNPNRPASGWQAG